MHSLVLCLWISYCCLAHGRASSADQPACSLIIAKLMPFWCTCSMPTLSPNWRIVHWAWRSTQPTSCNHLADWQFCLSWCQLMQILLHFSNVVMKVWLGGGCMCIVDYHRVSMLSLLAEIEIAPLCWMTNFRMCVITHCWTNRMSPKVEVLKFVCCQLVKTGHALPT